MLASLGDGAIFYEVAFLVTLFTGVIFSLIILTRAASTRFNVLLGLMNAAVAVWAAGRYEVIVSASVSEALPWVYLLYVGSIFIHVFFFHAILVFLNRERPWRIPLVAFYVNAVFLVVLTSVDYFFGSHLFIGGIRGASNGLKWIEFSGTFYNLHLINELLIPTLAFAEMIMAYKHLSEIKTAQLRLVIISSLMGFVGGNTILLPIYGFSAPPVGILFVPVSFIAMTYAIFRYRLVPFKIIVTEIFSFGILITLLVQMIYATTAPELIFRTSFLVVISIFLYLLIRSVYREVEQREEIQRLSNEKSEFMAFASHEIRNPITALRGYASLVLDGTMGEVNDQVKDTTRKMLVIGDDVLSLISQFLNKSKTELGQIAYDIKDVDLRVAITAVVNGYVPHAALKGLMLDKEIDPAEDLHVKADEGKLKEVVGNIIDNSLKYTKKGNVTVSVHRHGVHVRIVIEDTGVGIPAEIIPHLFQKFSRADAQKVNLLGTGIGLYLAKTFIEGMGARIWVESDGKDKGSRFIIEFTA